jgi:hypothetical protein
MLDPQCCLEFGGQPQGANSMCTGEQACCGPNGMCVMYDPLCCEELGGVPQGPDSMCAELQGCCLDDGTCMDLDPLCCEEMGGTPQGPDTGCADITIACCLPDGDCLDVDPLCCDDLDGVPSPIGASQCLGDLNGNEIDDACEEPATGACCDRATCLEDLTHAECDNVFGTYLGDGSDCGPPNPCAGACCDPETGDCVETDEIGCHKMHHEQLPDPFGWDVLATQPLILADDFRCAQTGLIRDIHFWGSWRGDMVGQIVFARFSIHADIPAEQSPTGFSMPGELLWSWEEPPGLRGPSPHPCRVGTTRLPANSSSTTMNSGSATTFTSPRTSPSCRKKTRSTGSTFRS